MILFRKNLWGLVSTARITHATPGALYAHTPERNWESDRDIPSSESACKDIAMQFIENIADIQASKSVLLISNL